MLLHGPNQRKTYAHYLKLHNRLMPRILIREMVSLGFKTELLEIAAEYESLTGNPLYVDDSPQLKSRKQWFNAIFSRSSSRAALEAYEREKKILSKTDYDRYMERLKKSEGLRVLLT
jgi:hypothetical protein